MPDDYFDPENTVGFLIWDANRTMNQEFSDRIDQHGVSLGLWPFLRALWEGNGLTQKELSKKVRMKRPTTVTTLNKLEARGLACREENKKDARKINVCLTREGRKIYRRAIPEVEAVNRHCMSALTHEEQEIFLDTLKRIRNTIAGT